MFFNLQLIDISM